MRGLYVHFPFCVQKCSYCDFYSLPNRKDAIKSYIQAILQEAQKYAGMSFDTLYIGGGTPSLLGVKNLQTLVGGINRTFRLGSMEASTPRLPRRSASRNDVGQLVEATIEVNPESATSEFLEAVKNAGFNRVSFGVQSLADDELKSVGRIHTAEQAIAAIKLAKGLNFQAISADLIIGLPGQTSISLHKSLEILVGFEIQHLSVYCLSLEAGTPLADNPPADLPSDDTQAELFEKTRVFLQANGFTHYEISNFALKGYECQHNLNYWRGGEYLGLGPAAASHLDGKRFKNYANLDAYLNNPMGQTEYVEEMSSKDKTAEEAMLRLRLLEEGLNTDELTNRFGKGNVDDIIRRLDKMASEGLLINEGSRYRLNPVRILTSNPIFARVIANEGNDYAVSKA